MRKRQLVIDRCTSRKVLVLAELNPVLRERILELLELMRDRVTPWCGYRGPADQARALEEGNSEARFGESPHNFTPALACDVVLNPAKVLLRPHPADVEMPDLWDRVTPDALATWEALEVAAKKVGLERTSIMDRATKRRVRDWPHLQLPAWRSLIPH